ncbi:MAG: hypothetical protein ACLFMO_06545 [Eubacteriales bacterium]
MNYKQRVIYILVGLILLTGVLFKYSKQETKYYEITSNESVMFLNEEFKQMYVGLFELTYVDTTMDDGLKKETTTALYPDTNSLKLVEDFNNINFFTKYFDEELSIDDILKPSEELMDSFVDIYEDLYLDSEGELK